MSRHLPFILFLILPLMACDFSYQPLQAATVSDLNENGVDETDVDEADVDETDVDETEVDESDVSDDISMLSEAVQQAIKSGSIENIETSEELVKALEDVLTVSIGKYEQVTADFFINAATQEKLGPITWDPTHDSAILIPSPGVNREILFTNDSANGADSAQTKALAVIGETTEGRYLVMGSNPFRNAYKNGTVNDAMHQFMENSIKWLANMPVSDLKRVVIANMDQSSFFPDYTATRNWLIKRTGPDFILNSRGLCDDDKLVGCLFDGSKPDLLIISQRPSDSTKPLEFANTVAQALAENIPVLYLHYDGNLTDLGAAIFSTLRVTHSFDNYWPKLRITNSDVDDMMQVSATLDAQLLSFFDALENDDWSFDITKCSNGCYQDEYVNNFAANSKAIQSMLNQFDIAGTSIFEKNGYTVEKLAVLLADKYREAVTYPMDRNSTPRRDFLRAIYTDHAQYQRRDRIPVPIDLGNFSRTVFTDVALVNKSIEMVSRVPFRAAGVYALPGEQVTITRNDDEGVIVYVQVNSIRTGATHIWDYMGYKRPAHLTSQRMKLNAGETLTFTSTYGGPIHLYFSSNEKNVSFGFKNIALHPFWNGPEDDVSFQAGLEADLFDWAELSTPAFEVHSKIEKMRDSASNTNWPNGAALAEATMTYTYNYPHVLAGLQGPGIDVVDEIHDFANANGWVISNLNQVKHMNADQALCGSGCSGNPYDAYWSFNPVGHGDIHELGHGLERDRFRFKNKNGSYREGHSITNPYSYYSKSRFYEETGQAPSCQSLPFDEMYERLQAAQATSDPFAAMAQLNLTAWKPTVVTYIQWMMAAENQGVLENGWHLWARLHMFDREFDRADNSESSWNAKKANLGMGNLSRGEAKALGNNDWMVLALSFITGRDYRPMFDLYGIAITAVANTQLNLLSYPEIQAKFYGADGNDFCLGFDKAELPLDGTSAWPY